MRKLVLIDGNAILHRAYHALPPLTTKRGEPINAVYGFISMFLKLVQDLRPTHVAVCFDRKEPTFRHEVFAEYQAQRPAMESDLSSQFEKARDVISAFGIPIYDKAGYEADDVIGTLAKQAVRGQGLGVRGEKRKTKLQALNSKIDEVVIVTGDRDILQLVTDKIKVYLPIRGLSDAQLMGEKDVFEKMGVKPEQIADYKALVGDPSDNYPGVSGIGPKTAIKLIARFKSLDQIYKNLDKLEEPLAKKLREGKESANLSQKLAKLITNTPIKINFDEARKWKVDSNQVLTLFAEFGFKTLTKRVRQVGKAIVSESQIELI